jgi:AraC family transcriptional regulator
MTARHAESRTSIGAVLLHLPDAPIATTRNRGWSGVTLDLHAFAPHYLVGAPARDHHLICYCPSGRGRLIQRRAGKIHDSVISTGMSILMPAGYDSVWEGDAATSARLRVPSELVLRASEEIGVRAQGSVELLNIFQMHDPAIESFGKSLLGELDRPSHPAQLLIVEAVSHALAAHLLRSYNAFEAPPPERVAALSARTLAAVISYIEDHLAGPISLTELASIAQVSRFHFTRLFKRSTGLTPMAYLERSRIGQAQELLRRAELPLSEVALAVGFADQSHFTRRFHRHVGISPAAFAREYGARRLPRRMH